MQKTITADVILYGTKENNFDENALTIDVLSTLPENIITAIALAKKDGYKKFKIVDYTEQPITAPDFIGTINK